MIWLIWIFLLPIKIYLSTFVPLLPDEAYYWVWSLHPQLSYFDHPPVVAWLFRFSHYLPDYFVRLPFILVGHITLAIWILILKKLYFSEGSLGKWFAIAAISPFIGFGSLMGTPDVPLIFFWSLSLYLLIISLRDPSLTKYILFGCSLGFGFLSKYHMVLFVPSMFLYLWQQKEWKSIQWRWVPLTIVTGLFTCLPVLIWNFKNDFASIKFQLDHGFGGESYDPFWTYSFILGQIFLVFPPIFLKSVRSKWNHPLFFFAWVPMVFFLLTSSRNLVEANWPIMSYPAIFALATYNQVTNKNIIWKYLFWIIALVFVISMIPSKWAEVNVDKAREPFMLKDLHSKMGDISPVYSENYQQAASLWYLSKRPVYKMPESGRYDFFDTFKPPEPLPSKLYLVVNVETDLPPWAQRENYQAKEIVKTERYKIWELNK